MIRLISEEKYAITTPLIYLLHMNIALMNDQIAKKVGTTVTITTTHIRFNVHHLHLSYRSIVDGH